jgi:hypothetical protein
MLALMRKTVALSVLCGLVASCSYDGSHQGARSACAGGQLECVSESLESAEDVCWRLVECGAIPLTNPEGSENCCIDWDACTNYVASFEANDFAFVSACVEISSCDELKARRSPTRPPASSEELPLCLQYGDQ